MLCDVNLRRTLLVCAALSCAAIDLVYKSLVAADYHQARTQFVALIMFAVIAALVVLVPRVPSNPAAVGAGIACGGALGNLISLLAWSQGVPDPIVVSGALHGVAFNLADLFALTGDALLIGAIPVHGAHNRARLGHHV
jgi:lipoprotein signal peptidase